MTFNILLVIFLLLVAINCIIGVKRGMAKTIFRLVAWILVLWFIYFSTPFIKDFLTNSTTISSGIEEVIYDGLQTRYDAAEEEESGSGETTILNLLPENIKDQVEENVHDQIEYLLLFIAQELTATAIQGLAVVVALIVSIILIKLIELLLKLIDFIPGLNTVNRLLGFVAGLLQAIFIVWIVMLIADCFPTTTLGSYIITYSQESLLLSALHDNNLIAAIIGIQG